MNSILDTISIGFGFTIGACVALLIVVTLIVAGVYLLEKKGWL